MVSRALPHSSAIVSLSRRKSLKASKLLFPTLTTNGGLTISLPAAVPAAVACPNRSSHFNIQIFLLYPLVQVFYANSSFRLFIALYNTWKYFSCFIANFPHSYHHLTPVQAIQFQSLILKTTHYFEIKVNWSISYKLVIFSISASSKSCPRRA